jgi:hypothetical protein
VAVEFIVWSSDDPLAREECPFPGAECFHVDDLGKKCWHYKPASITEFMAAKSRSGATITIHDPDLLNSAMWTSCPAAAWAYGLEVNRGK